MNAFGVEKNVSDSRICFVDSLYLKKLKMKKKTNKAKITKKKTHKKEPHKKTKKNTKNQKFSKS